MALSGNTVWEVRTTGADTNGGGFVSGASGTDYSQQDAKNTVGNNISTTDAVANGTTTITSATAAFTSAIVGNIIYLAGGSGSIAAGWYQVTAFTDAATITIDRTIAASTGMTLNIGGAMGSLGAVGSVQTGSTIAGHTVWIKTGTYSLASATVNISGGCFSYTGTGAFLVLRGYSVTRGDDISPPTLRLGTGVSSATMFTAGSMRGFIRNLIFDGNAQTSSAGLLGNTSNGGDISLCGFKNFTGAAINVGNVQWKARYCYATGCSANAFTGNGLQCLYCEGYGNSASPFMCGWAPLVKCLSYNNTGGAHGFDRAGTTGVAGCVECTAYGNGGNGFNSLSCERCYAEANTGKGFALVNASVFSYTLERCYTHTNTGGAGDTDYLGNAPTELSASALNNPASLDFGLNNTAGGGAVIRSIATAFPVAATTDNRAVGAAQPQAAGGASANPLSLILQPTNTY